MPTTTMHYSIQTSHHPSPYLTKLPFIAHDFLKWGNSVAEYADNSKYLVEVRYQEAKRYLAHKRPSVEEIWAQELISRPAHDLNAPNLPREHLRLEKVSNMLRRFLKTLATQRDRSPPRPPRLCLHTLLGKEAKAPEDGIALVARFMRSSTRAYVRNAKVSVHLRRSVRCADYVGMWVMPGKMKWKLVDAALLESGLASADELGKSKALGLMQVDIWVDVSDCVEREMSAETVEPAPVYESDKGCPSYEM